MIQSLCAQKGQTVETSEIILLVAPLVVLQLGLAVYALYDIYKRGGSRAPLPTWVWVLLVALGQLWGPVLYFFLGRKEDV